MIDSTAGSAPLNVRRIDRLNRSEVNMLNAQKVDPDRAMVLIIDLQTKLLPQIDGATDVLVASGQLIHGMSIFGLPMLATEQYPDGIGHTHDYIGRMFKQYEIPMLEKMAFSTCCEPSVKDRINEIDRPQVVVVGIEAHVCVLQSTLDLLAMGCDVYVCADAVGSRRRLDYEQGLSRMKQEGAVITTVEAVLFETCHRSGTEQFKRLLPVIKDPALGAETPSV